jgi:ubiquinone/menaquinone biosynthesis C-methylase UbiE
VLYYGLQFAAYSPNSTIVCMDISQASLDIARDRTKAFARHFSHIKVEFLRNSILELPSLKLDNFDLINCIGVLHHMEDYKQGLVNLRDNLNDDGGMVIMVPDSHSNITIR